MGHDSCLSILRMSTDSSLWALRLRLLSPIIRSEKSTPSSRPSHSFFIKEFQHAKSFCSPSLWTCAAFSSNANASALWPPGVPCSLVAAFVYRCILRPARPTICHIESDSRRSGTEAADPHPIGVPTVQIAPTLAQLPVFVRGGSILPMAPLTQGTDETPKGPLTLRIYAGDPCVGELYLDDGKTYAFEHGSYLRANFTCQITSDGLRVRIGAHEGSYPAWWKQVHIEAYGWKPVRGEVTIGSGKDSAPLTRAGEGFSFELPDDGKGIDVLVQ